MAKLSSSLPKGNGLGVAVRRLADGDPVVALVVLRRQKRVTDYEKDETELYLKISEVEAVHPDDLYLAKRLMGRALEARTGQPTLPYDLERALEGVFDGIDLDYPEMSPGERVTLPEAEETPPKPNYCIHCGQEIHAREIVEEDGARRAGWADTWDRIDCPGNEKGHRLS